MSRISPTCSSNNADIQRCMSWESIRKKVTARDMAAFALSLLFAFAIWLIHNLSYNYREQVSIPVLALCNIDGHAYSSSSPAVLHARCRASGFSLISLLKSGRRSPVEVKFSGSDLHHKTGEIFYVTSSELDAYSATIFGDGASVEAYYTDTLFFRFPYQNSRRVPVAGRFNIAYRPQYAACGGLEFEPDSVTVFGPPSVIGEIGCVFTKVVDIRDVNGPLRGTVKIDAISGVRFSDDAVDYSLDVSRYVELVSETRVEVVNAPPGRTVAVYPPSARVAVRCRFPVSSGRTEQPKLSIDYSDFKNSISGRCVPGISGLPSGAIDVAIEPEVFDCMEIAL